MIASCSTKSSRTRVSYRTPPRSRRVLQFLVLPPPPYTDPSGDQAVPLRRGYRNTVNEWGFAAEIKSWWDDEFSRHPEWKLTRCEVEQTQEGDRKRSDIVVLRGGVVRLSGELRLPDHPVASPWHPDSLLDAINKATLRGSRWAFTSDGTLLVLIDTRLTGPPAARVAHEVSLVPFRERTELDSEVFLESVREAWESALSAIAPIVTGQAVPAGMAPDEVFVNSLRALLTAPVAAIREGLNRLRSDDAQFADRLITWMVDDQGWAHNPSSWEAELLRTAQLTAYVFTTRLMFYEALRRSNSTLSPLTIPEASAAVATANLKAYFEEARVRSGDYETLFTWDTVDEFAITADDSISPWRRVLEHIALFDVSTIGYDLLGKMFERLIDPHERYRWGQHYTSPDVVDLMLSLALPDGHGKVLDPAVGGGTFLVRAYVRKRCMDAAKSHQQCLSELYGIDTSSFAASLATVNLAVRELEFAQNYPQVTAKSFFQIDPTDAFMAIPSPARVALGDSAGLPISIGTVRAVVCNPPYVRLHELGEERVREAERVLVRRHSRVPVPSRLHGLSNYHVYFWFHAAQFLEPDGRLVLITAGEWLDSDYGAVLQEWLLDNFKIELCIESLAEPWFSEARVGTVVLAATLCADEREREDHSVRFVLLRRTLRQLFGAADSDCTHLRMVDQLRDRLLQIDGVHGEGEDFDWSSISQKRLRALGLARS